MLFRSCRHEIYNEFVVSILYCHCKYECRYDKVVNFLRFWYCHYCNNCSQYMHSPINSPYYGLKSPQWSLCFFDLNGPELPPKTLRVGECKTITDSFALNVYVVTNVFMNNCNLSLLSSRVPLVNVVKCRFRIICNQNFIP